MQQNTAGILIMLVMGLVGIGQVSANSEKGDEAVEPSAESGWRCADKEYPAMGQKKYKYRGLPGKIPALQPPVKGSTKST